MTTTSTPTNRTNGYPAAFVRSLPQHPDNFNSEDVAEMLADWNGQPDEPPEPSPTIADQVGKAFEHVAMGFVTTLPRLLQECRERGLSDDETKAALIELENEENEDRQIVAHRTPAGEAFLCRNWGADDFVASMRELFIELDAAPKAESGSLSPDVRNLREWFTKHSIGNFMLLSDLWKIAVEHDYRMTAERMTAALAELDIREDIAIQYDERRGVYFCTGSTGTMNLVDSIAEAVAETAAVAPKLRHPLAQPKKIAHTLRAIGVELDSAEAAVLSAAQVLAKKFKRGGGVSIKVAERLCGAYHSGKMNGQTGLQVLRRLERRGIVRIVNGHAFLASHLEF